MQQYQQIAMLKQSQSMLLEQAQGKKEPLEQLDQQVVMEQKDKRAK
jgi:hypothetical protein